MVRAPSFDKYGMKKGAWSIEEDDRLRAFVHKFGHQNWRRLPSLAGLTRCGKSCRLRWVNYLSPGLKGGKITKDEEDLIIKLHDQLGNKWSAIAAELPGRNDNEIKNHWHAHITKRGRPRGNSITLASRDEQNHILSTPQTNDSCFSQFINEQEQLVHDFGMFEEMQADLSIFSNYSDVESSFSSSRTTNYEEAFWSEDDILEMELWC